MNRLSLWNNQKRQSLHHGKRSSSSTPSGKSGAALIIVMWVLMLVSLIVATFSFEMQLETKIISMQRKRFKADQLALSGVELVRAMLNFEPEDPTMEEVVYEDQFLSVASSLKDGSPIRFEEKLGDGTISVQVDFEKGRRNIRTMSNDEWKLMFEKAGIPNTRWDEMLDCLEDWQDENDLHQLNGAESDDPFYREREYECKNAPVDIVDELLLIKNWGEDVLYGTPADEDVDDPIIGIANQLTTWGDDGKVNPNSASREVLLTLPITEEKVEAIIELRSGLDGEAGTDDDGLSDEDLTALGLDPELFTLVPEYITVQSVGAVSDIKSTVHCIFKLGEDKQSPLFWLEGNQTK